MHTNYLYLYTCNQISSQKSEYSSRPLLVARIANIMLAKTGKKRLQCWTWFNFLFSFLLFISSAACMHLPIPINNLNIHYPLQALFADCPSGNCGYQTWSRTLERLSSLAHVWSVLLQIDSHWLKLSLLLYLTYRKTVRNWLYNNMLTK